MSCLMEFTIRSIGIIESPYDEGDDMPIQPGFSEAIGKVIVDKSYLKGLKHLDGFSHIIILYYFDRAKTVELEVAPYLDADPKGIFAIRYPNRPNKIGLSIVELLKIDQNVLTVKGIDVLNRTPLIDIKPFVPEFDTNKIKKTEIGWLSKKLRNQNGG